MQSEHIAVSNGPWSSHGYGWLCSCGEWEFVGWIKVDADVAALQHMRSFARGLTPEDDLLK